MKQALAIGLVSFGVFFWFSVRGIYGGDSGDLVTAASQCGVAHPPGYPLYTMIGCLLNLLPFATPAWKLTLLSSLPHAAVLSMIFVIVSFLTFMPGIALITTVLLATNYLFFLYSVTPEVFAGLSLFLVGISFTLIRWVQTKKDTWWFILCFLIGLSLTHHHVLLFLAPAISVLVWKSCVYTSLTKRRVYRGILYAVIGFLPYLYVFIASRFGHAVVLWNNTTTISRFIRLITRADYGTFQSGALYGADLIQRLLQFKTYAQLVLYDLRIVGLILICVGWFRLAKKQPLISLYMTIAYLSLGPFFFFYASFPLMNRFTLGTYERFMLPGYLILYIYLGIGLSVITSYIFAFGKRTFSSKTIQTVWRYGIITFICFYAGSQVYVTGYRFWGIGYDKTANNLGIDILESLPPRALLILGRDTPLFTTQYVRYALNVRPDVSVIHATRLATEDYQEVLQRAFPSLSFPAKNDRKISSFIMANASSVPVYANQQYPTPSGYIWINDGLLYKLASSSSVFSIEQFIKDNDKVWNSYHHPMKGILSRYTHLMLADVLGVYADARVETAKVLLKLNRFDDTIAYADAALSYHSEITDPDAYMIKALAYTEKNDCDRARKNVELSQSSSLAIGPESYALLSRIYAECYKDPKKAQEFKNVYEDLTRESAIPLTKEE